MEYVRRNWFVYIILAISFYVFPLIVKNTGIAMLVMLIAIPAICFGFSVIYGIRNGFHSKSGKKTENTGVFIMGSDLVCSFFCLIESQWYYDV